MASFSSIVNSTFDISRRNSVVYRQIRSPYKCAALGTSAANTRLKPTPNKRFWLNQENSLYSNTSFPKKGNFKTAKNATNLYTLWGYQP